MDQITRIAVEQLHESPFNPRRTFGETGLQELAADLKHQGVLSPLLVRPRVPELFAGTDDPNAITGYELVFGHRRLRAAQIAGLVDVPCMVRAMTDEEAKRAQISENLAREDVHPIEEAEGFQALIDDGTETADTLAERYGKSRSYVYGRLTLLKACKEIRDACVAGEIGSEVALLISRLRTDKLQQKALGYIRGKYYDMGDGGAKSYREIRDLLSERFTLALTGKDCMFDTADALLLPDAGACTTCPKRTGNAPEYTDLLQDSKGHHGYVYRQGSPDLCTDPDCYDAKKKAHLRNEAAALEAKGKTVIDGAKARQAVDAQGKVKGAYVALKDVKDEMAKARKASQQQLVSAPTVVTIQDPRTGKTIEAVKVSELEGVGVKLKKPSEREEMTWQERQRRDEEERKRKEEKAKEEAVVRTALLKRVREAVAGTERSAFDLGLVARVTLGGVDWNDRKPLATLYGLQSFEALQKKVGQMSVAELTQLMMDCALVADTSPSWHNLKDLPEALLAAAKHYGVDPNAVRAELVQASAPAASTPSTAARAPKGGKGKATKGKKTPSPAARAPEVAKAIARGVKYRDPMTGSTWTGRGLKPAWLRAALEQGKTLADFELPTPTPAARAQGKAEASDAAGQEKSSAGSAGESQKDEAGFAGEEQMDDAGVTAGGCDAEVAA